MTPPKEMQWVHEFLWLAESCPGTWNWRRLRSPPGFLEKVTFELDLDKSVGFVQALGAARALGAKPGLWGQTVAGSSPFLFF